MNSRIDMEAALLNDLVNGKNPQLRDLIERVEKYPVKREAGVFKDLKGEVITVEISE
ncbi:hypothetical protein D3C71_998760 [compost metagenome]